MKKWLVMTAILLGFGMAGAEPMNITPYLGDSWYGLYFNGEKVGYLLKRVDLSESGEVHVIEDAHFMITMSGAKQDMSIYSKRAYADTGALLYIEAEMQDPAQVSTFHAAVQNDKLVMKSVLGGAIREEAFTKPAETLTDALRHALWVRAAPAVGDVLNFSVFEPMYEKEVSGISRIEAIERRIFNGVETRVYQIHTAVSYTHLTLPTKRIV
mgnify:CR=1 FL=1